MKRFCRFARLSASSLGLMVLMAHGVAPAAAVEEVETTGEGDLPLISSHDCYSVGEEVAAQKGGTLARATTSTRDERKMCTVVVLIPASDGQRPRRAEILVPFD